MKLTSIEKKENNIVELEIFVPPEELNEASAKAFKRKAKTLNVPGFRKGKAPRQIIEKMYGEGIFMEDAVNEIYPKAYSEAIDEAGIIPVDKADVDVTTLDKEKGLVFKAIVTVKPEVTLGNYKGIKADKFVYATTDADVDAEIERMRDRNARIISVADRAAIDGDEVIINFEGFVDGVAFDGGQADGHHITLGSHSFIDTFEDQIVGHNVGDDFDVNVNFPEEYHAENLKGKPAVFKVKLVEIKGKELPELDDEFAKDVSEFDTVDELKANIRKKQEEAKERKTNDELENALIDEVINEMQANIPDCMIENRISDMVQDFEYRISQQGMKIDMYLQYTGMSMEAFRESFREQAEKQVKTRLALEKIGELENLEATEDDITAEYEKICKLYQMPMDNIRKIIPEKELLGDIKSTKAIDFVRDNAVITEKAPQAESDVDGDKKTAKKPAAKKSKKADAE